MAFVSRYINILRSNHLLVARSLAHAHSTEGIFYDNLYGNSICSICNRANTSVAFLFLLFSFDSEHTSLARRSIILLFVDLFIQFKLNILCYFFQTILHWNWIDGLFCYGIFDIRLSIRYAAICVILLRLANRIDSIFFYHKLRIHQNIDCPPAILFYNQPLNGFFVSAFFSQSEKVTLHTFQSILMHFVIIKGNELVSLFDKSDQFETISHL